ncbi:MAG TPA: hypothetical protein VGS22_21370 [Thermoanaerobaculia bacterium]|jgi:hypothetical protein|nr:hypothetical protein [Thermoanaerobaculia bacterium]
MRRRIFGALTLLALVAAVFASAPAVAANDCCAKACFCRHNTAAARGVSCALRQGGNPCGFRHPIPVARASAPERPALPLRRVEEIAPPIDPPGTWVALPVGHATVPPQDLLTPPPRTSSSLAA